MYLALFLLAVKKVIISTFAMEKHRNGSINNNKLFIRMIINTNAIHYFFGFITRIILPHANL